MEVFTPWKLTNATNPQPFAPTKGLLLNVHQHTPGLRGLQIEWESLQTLQPWAVGIPDLRMKGFSDVSFF